MRDTCAKQNEQDAGPSNNPNPKKIPALDALVFGSTVVFLYFQSGWFHFQLQRRVISNSLTTVGGNVRDENYDFRIRQGDVRPFDIFTKTCPAVDMVYYVDLAIQRSDIELTHLSERTESIQLIGTTV